MTGLSLGLDVGGTKIASGLVDRTGTLVDSIVVDTAGTYAAVFDQIAAIVDDYRRREHVSAIGVAVPGSVDPHTHRVLAAPNLGWRNLDLAAELSPLTRLTEKDIHIENDANAADWAEHRYGGGGGDHTTALITIGTGIGGGLVVNDRLVHGWTGAACELGHLPLVPDGRACECGSDGCWEQYASGRALTTAARRAGWKSSQPGAEILAAASDGHLEARSLVAAVARHLVHGIRILSAVLDPRTVFLGGGLGTDPRFTPFVREAEVSLPATLPRSSPSIEVARLGANAGIIGAADLAREYASAYRAP